MAARSAIEGQTALVSPALPDRPVGTVEPPPSRWAFPETEEEIARAAGDGEVVGVGADLEPGTILAAYRHGLFPMPVRRGVTAWWSPTERGIIPLDGLRVSRSLRQSCARYQVRVDTAFDAVIDACADRQRPGAWINKDIKRAYLRLHELGWAHSVEAWSPAGELAGGLYGISIGGLFAGESMFHRQTDASKVALVALVDRLVLGGAALLDVQWVTPHLASLGAVAIPRAEYHRRLAAALDFPEVSAWGP
jgi:leucyl/phenylalanyl-tRNA---protein transferase